MDALSREREREREIGLRHSYQSIISIENLLTSWQVFLRGKRHRKDVAKYSLRLMDNIVTLNQQLRAKTYRHGSYYAFKVNDPKPRDIHKASVADRLVHHAVYRVLYPFFDSIFLHDSFSCRRKKGTHRALKRFESFSRKVSKNNTRTVWLLQCDIKKFFASIDHGRLIALLQSRIADPDTMWLLREIVGSFQAAAKPQGVGLPLGNLTSQLLVNIYMHELDQFIKRTLGVKYYVRYADDFLLLHSDQNYLNNLVPIISRFLDSRLRLSLHPNKVFIKTLASGVDFLGWVHFPGHRVLRTSTKRRMLQNLANTPKKGALPSYLGLLSHGNTYKLSCYLQAPQRQRLKGSQD